jgi:CheY-like chemotaxis protein
MKTALVVEPDPAISTHVAQSLTELSLSVDIEITGRRAIAKLVNSGYHLVVLNLKLPDRPRCIFDRRLNPDFRYRRSNLSFRTPTFIPFRYLNAPNPGICTVIPAIQPVHR